MSFTPEQLKIAKESIAKSRDYAEGVLSGEITACKWVQLAVRRDENDRIDGHLRNLHFSEYHAARVFVFLSYLKHYKGEWRGKPFILEPWQCWIISVVFGWLNEDGLRRYREVYEEVARKNGKTLKVAGIGGYMLLKDNEGAPEVYAAATTRKHAKILWDDASKMLSASPALKRGVKVRRSDSLILSESNDGIFSPLSRESETIDGTNPHAALIDELHAHKTPEVLNALISGIGSRSQPLVWSITTAGAVRDIEQSICLQKQDYAKKILEGSIKDDSFFGIIFTLDDGDDWREPENWIKANPNIEYETGEFDKKGKAIKRGSVKKATLAQEINKAINSPLFRYGVLTKHLNIWQSNVVSWANIEEWDSCERSFDLESLRGADVIYGGMDLSSTQDLTSLFLIAHMPSGEKRWWSMSWIPEARVEAAIIDRGVEYGRWIEEGWLIATPGNVVDFAYIHNFLMGHRVSNADSSKESEWVEGLLETHPIELIAIDRYLVQQFAKDIEEHWVNKFVAIGMGYAAISQCMKEFEKDFVGGAAIHNGNPLLRWAVGNVTAVGDDNGNVRPSKKHSREKIDPAVAGILAKGAEMSEQEIVDDEPQLFVF